MTEKQQPQKQNGHKQIVTTLGALVEAEAALQRVGALRLEAKLRYHCMKLMKLVSAETRTFHEAIQSLREQYGEPTNGGLAVKGEHLATFLKASRELQRQDVTIPWGPIPLSKLPDQAENRDGKTINVVADDLAALGPLVIDDQEAQGA